MMRRQLPGAISDQDDIAFFKALMSGEVRSIASPVARTWFRFKLLVGEAAAAAAATRMAHPFSKRS
jgi:hypothetical protein